MAKFTRAELNALWITGYVPQETDYQNLFESFFALLDDELILEAALAQLDVDIEAKNGVAKFPIPENMTLTSAFIRVDTAPVGSSAIWDINIGGATILSTKITILAGNLTSLGSGDPIFSTTEVDNDDPCTVDCDQVGATTPGQNPVLVLKYKKR